MDVPQIFRTYMHRLAMEMAQICIDSQHLRPISIVAKKTSHISRGLSSLSPTAGILNPWLFTRNTSSVSTFSSSHSLSSSSQPFRPNSSKTDSTAISGGNDADDDSDSFEDHNDDESDDSELLTIYGGEDNSVEIEIENIGHNSRRIRSRIAINSSLRTVWDILTDYERLPEFIPGLAISQLLEKRDNFARLFQIGQQKLAFGINFNAKGIIDCYEKDIESFPFGQRREIEFKMIEGDFQLFEGKWSVEQYNIQSCEDGDILVDHQFHTILSYVVNVEPKPWLPVHLVEHRLSREIKMNLSSVQVEAQKEKTWDSS
ncbi:hypothetical protein NMG60_11008242 [Bertholletia excelsa]